MQRPEPAPQRLEPVILDAEEAAADHPFAHPSHYDGDVALLNYLLQDLRVLARQIAAGDQHVDDYGSIEWTVHGLRRRTVICDVEALVEPTARQMVGFFGDRRSDPRGVEIDQIEMDVVAQFGDHPGIISYSSTELIGDQWANLVVHRHPEDRNGWRHSPVHIAAAEVLAPRIYHNVRIHNGRLPGGPIGPQTVVIDTTKYWDYDVTPTWHAFRKLPGGLAETLDGPLGDASGVV